MIFEYVEMLSYSDDTGNILHIIEYISNLCYDGNWKELDEAFLLLQPHKMPPEPSFRLNLSSSLPSKLKAPPWKTVFPRPSQRSYPFHLSAYSSSTPKNNGNPSDWELLKESQAGGSRARAIKANMYSDESWLWGIVPSFVIELAGGGFEWFELRLDADRKR